VTGCRAHQVRSVDVESGSVLNHMCALNHLGVFVVNVGPAALGVLWVRNVAEIVTLDKHFSTRVDKANRWVDSVDLRLDVVAVEGACVDPVNTVEGDLDG